MTNTDTLPAPLTRAFWSVAIAGVTLTLLATVTTGAWRAGLSAAIGAGLALANLWSIAHLVRGFLAPLGLRLPWMLMGSVKMLVMLGSVFALLQSAVVSLIPLLVGFASLPLGIVFGQTASDHGARGEG